MQFGKLNARSQLSQLSAAAERRAGPPMGACIAKQQGWWPPLQSLLLLSPHQTRTANRNRQSAHVPHAGRLAPGPASCPGCPPPRQRPGWQRARCTCGEGPVRFQSLGISGGVSGDSLACQAAALLAQKAGATASHACPPANSPPPLPPALSRAWPAHLSPSPWCTHRGSVISLLCFRR